MPRVTKALAAKAKHKKVLKATKGHYGARSRLFKTAKQSNIKHCSMLLETEEIKSVLFAHYGYQESQQLYCL